MIDFDIKKSEKNWTGNIDMKLKSTGYIEMVLKKNETAEFQILMNGIPVKSTIRVIQKGGGSSFINSTKDGIIVYKFRKSGKYLFTTNHKRVGASLTFFIPDYK